jgi:hypothetical protein
MSGFSPAPVVSDMDVRDTSTTKLMRYGSVRETWDGKRYRYGYAGAVDLAAGKINVAAASAANHTNIAVAAAVAVGGREVTATLGATAAAASLYADGRVVVNDAAGEGIDYGISDHAAVASAGVITAKLDDPIKVALTTSSEVSLVKSPWAAVIVAPGAIAHRPVGVNNIAIAAAVTGFFQTRGDCPVLSDGIITKNAGAILSDAVNGAVEIEVAGTVTKRVGTAPEATVDTEYYTINLDIE